VGPPEVAPHVTPINGQATGGGDEA